MGRLVRHSRELWHWLQHSYEDISTHSSSVLVPFSAQERVGFVVKMLLGELGFPQLLVRELSFEFLH